MGVKKLRVGVLYFAQFYG